jgi:hypothetical protein
MIAPHQPFANRIDHRRIKFFGGRFGDRTAEEKEIISEEPDDKSTDSSGKSGDQHMSQAREGRDENGEIAKKSHTPATENELKPNKPWSKPAPKEK